jgi:protein-histidine pros-kinase
MRKFIPDTIFLRLFLLLFLMISVSHFIGSEFIRFEHPHTVDPEHLRPHPYRIFWFIIRISSIALTAWIGARWLSVPINQLAGAARELGENLDRAPLDESRGPDEIRQASRVFNQMQSRLKQQLAERNRFLAAVSHDLRTPITRLKLRAVKIENQDLHNAIQNDLNEMTVMIDATLDYLRGEGKPEALCHLDVLALVQSLAENALEQGEEVNVTGSAQPIIAQPMALQRCLNNLVGNALRYGNRADINLDDSGEKLQISIHDTGPGIPEDQLEAVFAPFFRLDQSRSRHSGGVGLGLAIARDIALKSGGSLTLKNDPTGGLVATLELPKRR